MYLFKRRWSGFIFLIFLFLVVFTLSIKASSWLKTETEHFSLFYENKKELSEVQPYLGEVYTFVTSKLSYYPKQKTKIYIYHSRSEFLKKSPSEKAVAFAAPFEDEIHLDFTGENIKAILIHEYTHILFIRSILDINKVPFWFNEGLAIYFSQSAGEEIGLGEYIYGSDIIPLQKFGSLRPSDDATASKVGYEGYGLIKYMTEKYGEKSLSNIISDLQKGEDFSKALFRSIGINESTLYGDWQKYAQSRSTSFLWSNLAYLEWIILGVLFILAVLVFFWQRHRWYKKQLEKEVEQGFKDFDNGLK